MKVAFLNIYQGNVNRGAETFVSELAQRLGLKFDVEILGGKSKPLGHWPVLWRIFFDPEGISVLVFTLKLIPKILKEKYDVVVPVNGGWQALIIRILTLTYGGKLVISGQSGRGWMDRINLAFSPDAFVAITSENKVWAERVNPFVRSVYVPNGVDLGKFSKGVPYSSKSKVPIIICVSALEKNKKVDLVVRAVSKIKKVKLLVVGKGREEDSIRKLGDSLLGDRFELTSFPHDKMPEVYRKGDVFCFVPWSREAFGIVFVEALASNLPVVARNDALRREIIGDAGILVDNPEDPDELGGAIRKALSTKWGDKPRNQAKKFSWDKIAREYEKLLVSL